jgi:outer membrane protein OmpA-like peptidoglycan-associated protein
MLCRTRGVALVVVVCALGLLTSPLYAQQAKGSLGSKDPGLFNLTGAIYFLKAGTREMPPNISVLKSQGTIYTNRIDVPSRDFTEGFPGVTNRFEWFGILYSGRFFVDVPGEYGWGVASDDGSRLWIDGQLVVNNDGVHGMAEQNGKIQLAKGAHDIALWYFQGPATSIGLQLFVMAPDRPKAIFDIGQYAGPMDEAVKALKAEATPDGIRVRLDAALLFGTAKWNLKPSAQEAIRILSQVISGYPAAHIRIVGYTDAVGGDGYNLGLSRSRAQSVRTALAASVPRIGMTFETAGLGKASPVASNDTEAGRALNRRVEVFIKPQAKPRIR